MSSGSTRTASSQMQTLEAANQLLNVQETMKGVVQTLEHLERVAEGVNRPGALRSSPAADANHTDTPTTLDALSAKLGCLQGILASYKSESYRNQCIALLYKWYQERQRQYSPVLTQAALDSVSACVGEYQMKTADVRLNEWELAHCATRLYEACSRYHDKADKVSADPQGYISRDHVTKVFIDGRYQDADARQLVSDISREIKRQEVSRTGTYQKPTEDSRRPAGASGTQNSGDRGREERKTGVPDTDPYSSLHPAASRPHTSVAETQTDCETDMKSQTQASSGLTAPEQCTEHPCTQLIRFLDECFASSQVRDYFQAKPIIEHLKVYIRTHKTERDLCVRALNSWYLEHKQSAIGDVLLVIASGVNVACGGNEPINFDKSQLQTIMWNLYFLQYATTLETILNQIWAALA